MSAAPLDLPPWFTPALAASAQTRRLDRGAPLFREGDRVGGLFYVLEGEMKAVRYMPDGSEVVMMRAGAGEFFAESALAAERYSCDAICVKEARLAFFPASAIEAALAEPAFARAFLLAIAGHARRQCSRYERLRLRGARERVLHMILCEAGPDGMLDWKPPLAELAAELALEPETLYRVLAELEAEGRIRREKRRLWLRFRSDS